MTLSSRQEELRTQQRQKIAILFRITLKRIPIYIPSFIYLSSSKRYYSRHAQAVSRPPLLPTAFCTSLSLKTHSSRPEESPYLWKKSSVMAISIRNTPLKNKLQNKQGRGKENGIVMHASSSALHSVNDFTRSHKGKKPFDATTELPSICRRTCKTQLHQRHLPPHSHHRSLIQTNKSSQSWNHPESTGPEGHRNLTSQQKKTLATSAKNPRSRTLP